MHFVNTGNAMVSNPGMTWDQASIGSGISMSYSFNPGWDAQRRQSMPNEGTSNYINGQYYGTEPVAFTNSNKAMNSNLLASNSKRGVYSDSWGNTNNGGDYLVYEAKFVNDTRTQGTLIWYNSQGKKIANYPAVSGSGNPKYFTIPEGKWEASYLNSDPHPKYSRNGISFRVTLGPDRYDDKRGRETGLIRIHPARSLGTEGCIGLIGDRNNLYDFYQRYCEYQCVYGTIPVYVIYSK